MNNIAFLKDEVRNGFYIPTAIKQAWSAQLTILSEIDKICKKHNIEYYADWGTLIGTVRHAGYVPWDDDMDICMKRADYEKFKKIAKDELPESYDIQDFETKENHWLFLSRVVNAHQICFEQEHLDSFNNFPYIATVDVFVLDYLYRDEEEETKRCDEIKYILAIADGITNGTIGPTVIENELSKLEKKYKIKINRTQTKREISISLYKLAQTQMARVDEKDSDNLGYIFPWVLKGSRGFSKKYYEQSIELPFENTMMPVPQAYHEALKNHYGDYLKVVKSWGGHGYPYFEGQRENLQAVADFKLPEFTYNPDMTHRDTTALDKSESLKTITAECINELEQIVQRTVDTLCSGDFQTPLELLPECQQLAIDLGTLIEDTKGKDRSSCSISVKALEEFCESVFGLFEQINIALEAEAEIDINPINAAINSLVETINNVEITLQEQIINHDEILFVATAADAWSGFDSLYRDCLSDDTKDVFVVAVPTMTKNALGQITMTDEQIKEEIGLDKYPKDITISDWDSYNIGLHHPSRIYIQDPYDGENPCLTIPPAYYAKILRAFTEELIFVPRLKTCEVSIEEKNDIYNMKHYVTAPGVVYADKIMVQSENIKERYVEKLTEFAGANTEAIWRERLEVCELPCSVWEKEQAADKINIDNTKKKMLFVIGANILSEYDASVLDKLAQRLETFEAYKDNIELSVCLYPTDISQWEKINKKMTTEIVELVSKYTKNTWCKTITVNSVNEMIELSKIYDAYYGCSSPILNHFSDENKPVMLADFLL